MRGHPTLLRPYPVVAFHGQTSAGPTITNATWTSPALATIVLDTQRSFLTDTYTIRVPGVYFMFCQFAFTGGAWAATETAGSRFVNGAGSVVFASTLEDLQATFNGRAFTRISVIRRFAAGDTVSAQCFQESGANIALSSTAAENFMYLYRIGD